MKLKNLLAAVISLALGQLCFFLVEPAQAAPFEGTIVAAGDSLTAGYGVPERDAYPAQLERKLIQYGYHWKVVNAGISGETSSGLLSRVDWILKLKPDIVILETGANDGMRGVDPKVTGANIDKAVTRLQAKGVTVVLAGMRMFANLGPTFTKEFAANYTTVAKKHHLILIPFFLEGVAGVPALNQQDGIHPVASGYQIITNRVYPYVTKAIDLKRKKRIP
ncbi:arylesterase [Geomonas limicola]|uniref:Arylesterase n=1 Tax=Geomonas limicola TaxID=2740186 RepID=A0A6V8NBD3_9BACT|nr:arylesterase [Geomonas limicola]GFO69928.1 arylesterase [Geomonas limicola]